ncbi:MAG: hypothetical protein WC943_02065 [Elusimicrobiota bacterium]|jgi:hypothetical protein
MRTLSLVLSCSMLAALSSSAWSAAPALAPGEAGMRSAYEALTLQTGQVRQDIAARGAAAAQVRRHVHPADDRNALPEVCTSLPVVFIRSGEIYKNGQRIGSRATLFKANCDGFVVWADNSGDLHLDGKRIASRVNDFDISWYGDTVVWKDQSGDLTKYAAGSSKEYGRMSVMTFLRYTGDVVWKDSWGDLYRNQEKFGRVSSYKAALRTGDVAWTDSYGTLHKNREEYGRVSDFAIADRTGDVAWKDSYGNLYKGKKQVARFPSQWSLREDGVLIWVDSSGYVHYA